MENLALRGKSVSSSLEEIIDPRASKDTIFNEYLPREEIGEKIFKELHERIVDIDDVKMGFVMTDTGNDVGLLSQCQSLRALISLARDFKLGFDDKNIIPNQRGTIREIMDAVIEDVVERIIIRDENGEIKNFVFDASPYDSVHYTPEYSNVDAITWVIPSFFLILDYHAEKGEICKWEKDLIATIKHGIKYINEAYIHGNSGEDNGLSFGWNFTKNCEEPSLYFSFAVGECYLDVLSTFKDIIDYLDAQRNYRKYRIPMNEALLEKFEKSEAEYREGLKKKVSDKSKAKYDKHNELVRLYRLINDIDDLDELRLDNTLFGNLERQLKEVAEKVWKYVKKDLADKFFYNNLNTTLTEDDIRVSTTSDALFNTVYIVNIMIDAGLNKVFLAEKEAAVIAGDVKAADKYQREYNNLLESCQLAIQKTFRTYESLKSDSKDYIVDQFLIGFNEKFETHKATVNELRKLRMKVFSLLPMLIHTNNVVSEHLIKYPQHNMRKYLEYILDNRYTANGETHWIWELDGYFSGSNGYYISALNEFYLYYETYEKTYLDYGRRNNRFKKETIDEFKRKLHAPDGDITKLETESNKKSEIIDEKDAEIAALKKQIEDARSPMEEAVKDIIEKEMQARFASMLADTFKHASKALTLREADETEDTDGVSAEICNAMLSMVVARVFAKHFGSIDGKGKSKIKNADEYAHHLKKVKQDFDAVIAGYISGAINIDNGKSKLAEFFDKD